MFKSSADFAGQAEYVQAADFVGMSCTPCDGYGTQCVFATVVGYGHSVYGLEHHVACHASTCTLVEEEGWIVQTVTTAAFREVLTGAFAAHDHQM